MENFNQNSPDQTDFRLNVNFYYSPLILLSIMAIFGNAMVVASVLIEKRLRSLTTNHFVASLAISDLLVGAVAMPLAIYIKMNNNVWNLSRAWCQFHLVTTIFATAASILNLVAISIDRYFAIIFPTEYQRRSMRAKSAPYVAMIWLVSTAVSAPILLEGVPLDRGMCWIEDPQYLIMSALLIFFIPACIFIYLYAKIFRRIRKHLSMFWSGSSQSRSRCLSSLPQVIVEEVRSRRNSRIDNNSQSGSRSQSRKTSSADGAVSRNRNSSVSLDVPFSEKDLALALAKCRVSGDMCQSGFDGSPCPENVTLLIPTVAPTGIPQSPNLVTSSTICTTSNNDVTCKLSTNTNNFSTPATNHMHSIGIAPTSTNQNGTKLVPREANGVVSRDNVAAQISPLISPLDVELCRVQSFNGVINFITRAPLDASPTGTRSTQPSGGIDFMTPMLDSASDTVRRPSSSSTSPPPDPHRGENSTWAPSVSNLLVPMGLLNGAVISSGDGPSAEFPLLRHSLKVPGHNMTLDVGPCTENLKTTVIQLAQRPAKCCLKPPQAGATMNNSLSPSHSITSTSLQKICSSKLLQPDSNGVTSPVNESASRRISFNTATKKPSPYSRLIFRGSTQSGVSSPGTMSSKTSQSSEDRKSSMFSYGSSLDDDPFDVSAGSSRKSSSLPGSVDRLRCDNSSVGGVDSKNRKFSSNVLHTSGHKLRVIAQQVTHVIRRKRRECKAIRRETRATRVVASILAIFIVCWLPYFCALVQRGVIHRSVDQRWDYNVYLVTSWLGYAHSCFNCVIYTFLNRVFRATFKRLVCFWRISVRK